METPIINNIIPKDWDKTIKKIGGDLDRLAEKADKVVIGGGGTGASTKELIDVIHKYEKAMAKMQQATKKQAEESKKLTREEKLQKTINESLAGSYNQMQAQLSKNLITLKRLSEEERNNVKIGGKLIEENNRLNQSLLTIDRTMSMNQRNVGNYPKGFGLLGNAVQKLGVQMRLLGAAAIAAGMAFLAASIRDSSAAAIEAEKSMQRLSFAIKKVGGGSDSDIDKLTKKAEKLMGIFDDEEIKDASRTMINFGLTTKQVAQILPLMIDAAAASGKSLEEMASAIDKGVVSGVIARSALGQLGLSFKDTGSQTENYAKIVEGLTKFTGGNTEAMKSQWGQMQKNKIQWGELKESLGGFLNDIIIPVQSGLISILESAQTKATRALDEVTQSRLTSFKKEMVGQKDKVKYVTQEIEAERALYKAKQAKIRQNEEEIRQDKAKGFFSESTQKQSALKKENENLAAAITKSIAYTNALAGLRQEMIDGAGVVALNEEELATSTVKVASAFNLLKLEAEPAIETMKEIASSDKMSFDERGKAVLTWAQLRYAVTMKDKDIQLKALEDEYQSALKTTKDKAKLDDWYKQEKTRINLEIRNEAISIQKDAAKMVEGINKDMVKSEADDAAERSKTINMLLADEFSYYEEYFAAIRKKEEEEAQASIELEKKKAEAKKDILNESLRTALQLSDAFFSAQLNRIDAEIEKNEQARDEDLDSLEKSYDDGLISKDTYESEKARKEDYYNEIANKKKREAFKAEKRMKEAQIAIDLAAAIMNIWSKYAWSPPTATLLTALVSGVAIAQTAVIESQVPAFAEGGEQEKTGLALVGDGGKHELLMYPNGQIGITPDTNTLMTLPKGTTIYPDAEHLPTLRDIERKMIINNVFDSKEIVDELRILVSETRKKPKMIDQAQLRRQLRQ